MSARARAVQALALAGPAIKYADRLTNLYTRINRIANPKTSTSRRREMPMRFRSKAPRKRKKGWSKRGKYAKKRTRGATSNIGRGNVKSTKWRPTKSYKSSVNRLLGPSPGYLSSNKKTERLQGTWNNHTDLVLVSNPLINVTWNNVDSNSARLTGCVNLLGVKVKYLFQLHPNSGSPAGPYTGPPVQIRWAILCNKNAVADTSTSVPLADFFLKETNPDLTDVGEDFGTGFSALRMDGQRINPHDYLVLREGRMKLIRNSIDTTVGNVTGNATKQTSLYAKINEYIPLNTQVRFETNAVGEANGWPIDHQMYFVYWGYKMNKQSSDTGATTNLFRIMYQVHNYFKEPKGV